MQILCSISVPGFREPEQKRRPLMWDQGEGPAPVSTGLALGRGRARGGQGWSRRKGDGAEASQSGAHLSKG